MEHTDFSKILQSFLPIVIFILWAMFSNAGKKRKMRNFPERQTKKPVFRSDSSFEQNKPLYHQAPDKKQQDPAKAGPDVSKGVKAAATKLLPQHQPAIKISMPSDLQVHISPASGALEPVTMKDFGKYSVEELQKLIIWSEILNRPVGLRDPE